MTPPPDAVERVLRMTLSEFAEARLMVEVAVEDLAGTIWFASGEAEAQKLKADGVSRGRVWTVPELRRLMDAPGIMPEDVLSIARAKAAIGGRCVEIQPPKEPK